MPSMPKQIGPFTMSDRTLVKPVTITPAGEFAHPADIVAVAPHEVVRPTLLPSDQKISLVLERLRVEPDLRLGVLSNLGFLSQADVLQHVQSGTDFGKQVVDAHIKYSEEFIQAVHQGPPAASKAGFPHIVAESVPTHFANISEQIRLQLRTTAIFCENTTDSVTHNAAEYRIANVHPAFKSRGFNVISLEGGNDSRATFAHDASTTFDVFISGVGHGNVNVYTGDQELEVLQVGQYQSSEVDGAVIHLLSCDTAAQLGPDLVSKHATAYAGYAENFVFTADEQLFWECDSVFDLAMAAGLTVDLATGWMVVFFNADINSKPNTETAVWLTHDRDCLKAPRFGSQYGNPNATISSYISFPVFQANQTLLQQARLSPSVLQSAAGAAAAGAGAGAAAGQ